MSVRVNQLPPIPAIPPRPVNLLAGVPAIPPSIDVPANDWSELDLALHHKQGTAFLSTATEILYGGAAGGGKSHLMRIAAISWCAAIPHLQVYLFRRVKEDLVKNHMEGVSGFRALLAQWVLDGHCEIIENEIRFTNGSKIYLCHCKDEKHMYKYQGSEIHVLLIDEVTHFTEKIYRFLRNRVRIGGLIIPEQYKGLFPRILCGANPGNIGHLWVKNMFVDNVIPMDIRRMEQSEGGMLRQFITAILDDNPTLTENDPDYEARLMGLGSVQLVQAMRYGDWNVIEGAFFEELTQQRHGVAPFKIPEEWTRFRSGDWGSAKPFSIGWHAVVSDDYKLPDGRTIPRGAIVRYREWYGCVKGRPNTGLKMTAEQVARGTREREKDDQIVYGVMDPAAFSSDGGPSIVERMYTATGDKRKGKAVMWRPADNKRVSRRGAMGGWDTCRNRLVGDEDGRPMFYAFTTCTDFWRTVPAMQHDDINPEDMNTDGEDHVADEWRYALMSRPYERKKQVTAPPKHVMRGDEFGNIRSELTISELIKRNARNKRT